VGTIHGMDHSSTEAVAVAKNNRMGA
jgi:hypothetical protein